MSAPGLDRATLARADLLLVLAELLIRPAAARQWVPEGSGDLDELIALSTLSGSADGASALRSAITDLARDPEGHTADLGELFDGQQRCPPNETAYIRRDKGAILGDVAGFYRAFGFALAPGSGEKADHIATELQFVALLLVMLARAEAEGDSEAAAITRDALQAFVCDHLGEWLHGFADQLAAAGGRDGWRALARALVHSWVLVSERAGLQPPLAAPTPLLDDLSPVECGGCPPPAD